MIIMEIFHIYSSKEKRELNIDLVVDEECYTPKKKLKEIWSE